MLKPINRSIEPINESNLADPRGLYLQRLTRILTLALSCAPRYVYGQEYFVFWWMVRKLISLALIRLVFATELSLLFSDLSCFTLLSRPVSAVILPETIELYQKAVLEGRGTLNPVFW
jgi:hypothetical protein